LGGLIYTNAVNDAGINYDEIYEYLEGVEQCQGCVIGIYIILTGVGIAITMLVSNIVLSFADYDYSNESYYSLMKISIIITFIAWVGMLSWPLLIPVVFFIWIGCGIGAAAGGGGGYGSGADARKSARENMRIETQRRARANIDENRRLRKR